MRKRRKWQRGVQGKDRITRENPFSFLWVCPHTLTFLQNEWINMNEVKRCEEVFGHGTLPQAVSSAKHKERWKAKLGDKDFSSAVNSAR